MARATATITIQDDGRDKGKTFVINEMSCSQIESWGMRAILALMSNGVEVPEGFERLGMAGMAEMGIRALSGLKWQDAEPLLNEMMGCVQLMPDTSKPFIVRPLIESDIEEVMTRINLKKEVWKLHTDFLQAAAPSISKAAAVVRVKNSKNM